MWANNQPYYRHLSDQISRSARRAGATKNLHKLYLLSSSCSLAQITCFCRLDILCLSIDICCLWNDVTPVVFRLGLSPTLLGVTVLSSWCSQRIGDNAASLYLSKEKINPRKFNLKIIHVYHPIHCQKGPFPLAILKISTDVVHTVLISHYSFKICTLFSFSGSPPFPSRFLKRSISVQEIFWRILFINKVFLPYHVNTCIAKEE